MTDLSKKTENEGVSREEESFTDGNFMQCMTYTTV